MGIMLTLKVVTFGNMVTKSDHFEVLGKRETLQVLKNNYLQDLVVLGTGVEVRSTRANTLMAQTFRSSNKHIICSRNRQLR